jgi:hypothetical protein
MARDARRAQTNDLLARLAGEEQAFVGSEVISPLLPRAGL